MNFQQAGIGAIVLGILFLVASLVWTSIVPNSAVWSNEKALQYQEISAQLHDDSFNRKLPPEKLAESRTEFETIKKQLSHARAVKHATPFYLRVTGIAVCALGVGLILARNAAA